MAHGAFSDICANEARLLEAVGWKTKGIAKFLELCGVWEAMVVGKSCSSADLQVVPSARQTSGGRMDCSALQPS